MKIAGLNKKVNSQLALLKDVKIYFEQLAEHPSYLKTGEIDGTLDCVTDKNLRDALIHIGKHNTLPPNFELKSLTNGDYAESYKNGLEFGWADLQFLMRIVKATFMSETNTSHIRYARQAALYCKGCGEYKAKGMFEFSKKDESYTQKIEFTEANIIDPARTKISQKSTKDEEIKTIYHCVPCSTRRADNFEIKYEGLYASSRKYFYEESYLEELARKGIDLPKVVAVSIRTKEPGSEAEKLAYQMSVKNPPVSEHFKVLQENRAQLEKELGKETLDLLIEDSDNVMYDKFGMRIITNTEKECYELMDWFRVKFPVVRYVDFIAKPKANGYMSIHATLLGMPTDRFTPEPIPIDLQIRTRQMDFVAERGSAAWGTNKQRKELVDHKLFLAITAFRYYILGD